MLVQHKVVSCGLSGPQACDHIRYVQSTPPLQLPVIAEPAYCSAAQWDLADSPTTKPYQSSSSPSPTQNQLLLATGIHIEQPKGYKALCRQNLTKLRKASVTRISQAPLSQIHSAHFPLQLISQVFPFLYSFPLPLPDGGECSLAKTSLVLSLHITERVLSICCREGIYWSFP